MKKFNETEAKKLWELCQDFILKHKIDCPETIYQCDSPQIAAPELIEKICEVAGYLPNNSRLD